MKMINAERNQPMFIDVSYTKEGLTACIGQPLA
jgi:hypothetical protein